MKNKVFFSKNPWGNTYRPYLEIYFISKTGVEFKTTAIVDTGADRSLIRYSIGQELGFKVSLEEIRQKPTTHGIAGSLNSLNKETEIIIRHHHSGKVHKIKTPISWIIPTEQEFNELNRLIEEIDIIKVNIQNNPVNEKLKGLLHKKHTEYATLNNRLEPDILIGREFMTNFGYLTFVHETDNSKSYFEYELRSRAS